MLTVLVLFCHIIRLSSSSSWSRPGIPNLFLMATHLTKPRRFRDTPLTVRPPPLPSARLEMKIHNYIIKTNKVNLTARFCYLIISKAEFRLMTSDFKTVYIKYTAFQQEI
jgi:hypothetical protein